MFLAGVPQLWPFQKGKSGFIKPTNHARHIWWIFKLSMTYIPNLRYLNLVIFKCYHLSFFVIESVNWEWKDLEINSFWNIKCKWLPISDQQSVWNDDFCATLYLIDLDLILGRTKKPWNRWKLQRKNEQDVSLKRFAYWYALFIFHWLALLIRNMQSYKASFSRECIEVFSGEFFSTF